MNFESYLHLSLEVNCALYKNFVINKGLMDKDGCIACTLTKIEMQFTQFEIKKRIKNFQNLYLRKADEKLCNNHKKILEMTEAQMNYEFSARSNEHNFLFVREIEDTVQFLMTPNKIYELPMQGAGAIATGGAGPSFASGISMENITAIRRDTMLEINIPDTLTNPNLGARRMPYTRNFTQQPPAAATLSSIAAAGATPPPFNSHQRLFARPWHVNSAIGPIPEEAPSVMRNIPLPPSTSTVVDAGPSMEATPTSNNSPKKVGKKILGRGLYNSKGNL